LELVVARPDLASARFLQRAFPNDIMTDPETIVLRVTEIGGKRWPDEFTVIWRGLPIGRIMLAPGLPPHVPQWR
jgi:hypothetical protein